MRYAVKQRLVAFGDDFDILDQQGHKAFFVDGKAFSIGQCLALKSPQGHEIARISQKLMSFAPCYKISRRGKIIATVRKALFSLRTRFIVSAGGQNIEVVGNLFRYDYKFYRNHREVGVVSKKMLSFRDCYGIDIGEGEDEILFLCCSIIIDMILHNKK